MELDCFRCSRRRKQRMRKYSPTKESATKETTPTAIPALVLGRSGGGGFLKPWPPVKLPNVALRGPGKRRLRTLARVISICRQ